MKHSDSLINLAKALAEAQKELGTVAMTGFNNFDKYTYAKLKDYVKHAKPTLVKHGLMVIFSNAASSQLDNRTTKNGSTEYAVRVRLACTLLHSSGEWIEVEAEGDGQDRGDKGIYKATTGARKYGMSGLLNLATEDDAENDEPQGPPPPAQRPVARPTQASTTKQQVISAVAKWSGVPKEDLPRAVQDVIRKSGVKIAGQSASDPELTQILGWINTNSSKDFAEALA